MKQTLQFVKNSLGFLFLFSFFFFACKSNDEVSPNAERTVLFYFAADNNLYSDISKDIQEILKGMVGVNGRAVIYIDGSNRTPMLLTIHQMKDNCVLDTIETYPEENSVSCEVLKRVTHRVRELYPAASYGLVLGTHGSGWIPTGVQFPRTKAGNVAENRPRITRFLGVDNNFGTSTDQAVGIDVEDLVYALPNGYEFIAFDVCLMGNIEVLYALRHKAKYILASPGEIMLRGFPYDQIVPFLWGGESELKQVCKLYRDYYEMNLEVRSNPWGMLSLVRTAYLDNLANRVKAVLYGKKDEIAEMAVGEVWRYPLIDYTNDVFYDLREYIRKRATESQYLEFEQALNQVVYFTFTSKFASVEISSDRCCGIATYIPLNRWSIANTQYDELEWTQYVYGQ